jgi:RND family efflux transporter MFP subunit
MHIHQRLLRLAGALLALISVSATAAELATAKVREASGAGVYVAEAVAESVQQSVIAAQVAGRIEQLSVQAGDRVHKGQVLVRIDSQAAAQQASASQAQVASARAQLDVARKELERQQQLFRKNYLSQAALDQAEAQFKATEAALRGSTAQAGVASTQTGFYTLTAPYSGTVASVAAEVGEMALPGKILLTLYDPAQMRVVASLPQSRVAQLAKPPAVRIELPSLPESQRWQQAVAVTVLPTADAGSQSVQVRLGLPPMSAAVTPGMFARAQFTLAAGDQPRLLIPQRAVVRRTELSAVYVVSAKDGRQSAQLRQVRLGRPQGEDVEVLAGLSAGESVALDPVAAARAN